MTGSPALSLAIVDDDVRTVQRLAQLLRDDGFRVYTAHNVGEAERLAATNSFERPLAAAASGRRRRLAAAAALIWQVSTGLLAAAAVPVAQAGGVGECPSVAVRAGVAARA